MNPRSKSTTVMGLGGRMCTCMLAVVEALLVLLSGCCAQGAQGSRPPPLKQSSPRPAIGVSYPYVCPHDVTLTKLLINQTESGYVQYTEYATRLPPLQGFTMHYWFNLADASTTSTMFNYGLDERSQNNNLTVQLEVTKTGAQYWTVQVNDVLVSRVASEPPIRTGKWHHALHSYSPSSAHFSHFLDGRLLAATYVPVKHRMVVPGGGVAVSGQHQSTSLTMGMDQGEGLNGWFTLFQLSSKPIDLPHSDTAATVARLASQCSGDLEGDLISWRETPRKGYGGVMETPSKSKACGQF